MGKKLLPIALAAVLAATLTLTSQMVPQVYAEHSPKTYWTETGTDRLYKNITWPAWINFTVENLGGDPIVKFKFVIPKENDYAKFHYNQSKHQLEGWSATPDEFDPDGWPTVIIFESNQTEPIIPGGKGWFAIQFLKGPLECESSFSVYTIDAGLPPVTKLSRLYLIIDAYKPIISVLKPEHGENVTGSVLPCGHHYFTVYVKAEDDKRCSSGIKNGSYEIKIVDVRTGKVVWGPFNETIDKEPWEGYFNVTDLPEGTYNLTVDVCDLAGNKGSKTNTFNYIMPALPRIWLTPKEGYVGTSVTVSGEHFTPGANVKVTLVLPQGEIEVANTTVKTDGTFTAPSFTFPPTPQGRYEVKVYSHPCNKSAIFELKPQIIFKPNEVVGPAFINVEATGFIKPDIVPGTRKIYVLCNNKDSLQGVNEQAFDNWYIDERGTLQNIITYLTGRYTECGLFWPALQPGTYNVTLFLAASGSYWNISSWVKVPNFEHSNTITVISTLDLLPKIEQKLDELKPIITRIDGTVLRISTTVGEIQADIKDIIRDITVIKGDVVEIKTKVGTILGYVDDINWADVITIKTDVGTIKAKVEKIDTIASDVVTLKTDIGDIKATVTGVSGLGINIAAVLSAIAAIAAVITAVVVTRRLKVAA